MKFWSEFPSAQSREIVADAATALWVIFWALLAWQVYSLLSGFAEAGRLVHDGGVNLRSAGVDISASANAVPVVGDRFSDIILNSFTTAANPFVDFGSELETLIIVLSVLIAGLVLAVPVVPWLSKYVPWRLHRVRSLTAAHRVIRSPRVPSDVATKLLAARALYSMDYQTLLAYTPDPFGDFATGRHDRLARAELARVGLSPER